MARPLRLHIPGMLYHVMSRGDDKRAIFIDDDDYERFLARLTTTTRRFNVQCYAYCLLWNHAHLLLQPDEIPLSRMMQQLNSSYCQSFNRRHHHVGHVLQGRYKSPLVDSDVYFLRLIRYIVRNPVAAGYVSDPAEWRWSSYRATAGLVEAPPFLDVERVWAALDATNAATARERWTTFVSTAVDDDSPGNLFLIGARAFATQCAPRLRPYQETEDLVYAERFAARPPLSALFSRSDTGRALDEAVSLAFCQHAYTLREIASFVGRSVPTVWRWIQRARHGYPCQVELADLGTVLDETNEKIKI